MAFTPVAVDPHNIDACPGPYQHWVLNATGSTRYLFGYSLSSANFNVYRSTDSGASWSKIANGGFPATINDGAILQTQLIVGGGSGGSDLIRTTSAVPRSNPNADVNAGLIEFCEFDIGTLTWAGPTNIGGGFNQHTHFGLAATEAASAHRFLRGDGTTIIAYQCETFPIASFGGTGTGIRQVRILKLSGATTAQLATFATGTYTGAPGAADTTKLASEHYILWSAAMDGADNVHIFMNHAHVPVPDGGSFYEDPKGMELVHVSVAASNDAVSAVHSIEQDIEQMPALTNPAQPTASTESGRAAIKSDNSEIAIGYGFQTNTFPAGTGAHVHVARGDMTGDPLNPTWTVDNIATDQPVNWDGGQGNDVSVTYDTSAKITLEYFTFAGSTTTVGYGEHSLSGLKVYWASTGGDTQGKINFANNTGGSSWTAPAQLWPDPDSSGVSLDGFDVAIIKPTPVPPSISIACPLNSTATVGVFYDSGPPIVTGGTRPYRFEIVSGSLPPGYTLDSTTGDISGITYVSGSYNYTVEVIDSSSPPISATVAAPCPITVSPAPPPGVPCANVAPHPDTDNQFKLIKLMATMVPAKKLPVRGSVQ